ncbi:MAG: hypothetical protein PHD41_06010 [Methanosarcinaceae archaeon]|nr:hypothetical protein [Methanosarcinaceae archaeon]
MEEILNIIIIIFLNNIIDTAFTIFQIGNTITYLVNSNAIATISGGAIAALTGYFVSKKQYKDQIEIKLKIMARNFNDDIKNIESIIEPFVKTYEEEGSKFIMTEEKAYTLIMAWFTDKYKITLDVLEFIYDENCAYYKFQQEISYFDEECFNNINTFYRNMIIAQKYYLLYSKDQRGNYFLEKKLHSSNNSI